MKEFECIINETIRESIEIRHMNKRGLVIDGPSRLSITFNLDMPTPFTHEEITELLGRRIRVTLID